MPQRSRIDLHEPSRRARRRQHRRLEPIRRRLRRFDVEHVVVQMLRPVRTADHDLLSRGVHPEEHRAGAQLDAVLLDLALELAIERRQERGLRRHHHHDADPVQHPRGPPVIAGLIHRLLCGARAGGGPVRLGEDDRALPQVAQKHRGLLRQLEFVMGCRRRRLHRLGQPRHAAPVQLDARTHDELVEGDAVAALEHDGVRVRLDRGDGILNPLHAFRHHLSLRADGDAGACGAAGDMREQRLVHVLLARLDDGDVGGAGTTQSRGDRDAAVAPADHHDLMVHLLLGHGPSLVWRHPPTGVGGCRV